MNLELLRELVEAHGTSGDEGDIRDIVRRELANLNPTTDAMGSVIAVKKGSGGGKKVMLAAHTDEIGFIVKYVEDDGWLRVNAMGGWDPRVLASQRVKVRTKDGLIPGLMMPGTKPAHLLSDAEKGKPASIDDMFIDTGLGKAAKDVVRIGDTVTMDRPMQKTGDLITSKAMDDRVAVFVMLEALKKVGAHSADIYAVATSQEEIGLRGAAAAGSAIVPDVVIAIDITLANDIPGVPAPDRITKLGDGAAIKIMDSSLICHPGLVALFRETAEKHGIKHQMEILTRGGTDAGGVQLLHGGIPSFTLSIPTRYVHTPNETVHGDDVQACIDLLAKVLEVVGDADLTLR